MYSKFSEKVVQYFSPESKVYLKSINSLCTVPLYSHFYYYLMNAKYLISNSSIMSNAH